MSSYKKLVARILLQEVDSLFNNAFILILESSVVSCFTTGGRVEQIFYVEVLAT